MKFKVIFILFNVVIVVSFLIIYLMPLIMLGWDYTRVFWARNWGLPILFAVIIAALNAYFAFNWRLFRLLEDEDWNGLVEFLSRRIYEKKIVLPHQCRILINAYLVRSDLDGIERLEQFIRDNKPGLLKRLALPLGARHLLRHDPDQMTRYFGELSELRGSEGAWLRWCYAFALLLNDDITEAVTYLKRIAGESPKSLLLLLTIYLLDSAKGEDPDAGRIVVENRENLKKKYTPQQLAAEIERHKSSVHVVILARLIEEASDWLFAEPETNTGDLRVVH